MNHHHSPAFYINLDSRLDRREHIEAQLRRIGMTAERIAAVTPAEIAPERLQAAGPFLSLAELACSMSHQKAWQVMIERGLPGALILEDDAILSSRLPAVMASAELTSGADAVHFETIHASPLLGLAYGEAGGVTLHRLLTSSVGACAYYMTTDLATQLLARPDLDRSPIDAYVFGRGRNTLYRSRILQTVPALAVQVGFYVPSDTGVGRSDLELARSQARRRRTLGQKLVKIGKNLSHVARTIRHFGPTGDLRHSRRVELPLADDILAQI